MKINATRPLPNQAARLQPPATLLLAALLVVPMISPVPVAAVTDETSAASATVGRKGAKGGTQSSKAGPEKHQPQKANTLKGPPKPAPTRSNDQPSRSAARPTDGIGPSAYVGEFYRPGYEAFRRCIVHRESRGDYSVRNPSSGAAGAYQFLLSTSNVVAAMMDRPELVGRPASTWSRFDQDRAFFVLYDHGRGASHWGYTCG